MVTLIVVGFLAGVITSISPCVLPVLPVVLTAGATRGTDGTERTWSWRPYGVVLGLVLSFSLATLFGSLVLSALHLPQDLLRDAGIAVLVLIGVGLIWTRFGDLLARPFTRLPGRQVDPNGNGIVLGLGLGLLYVPCAGPVLATIAVIGATHKIGFGGLVLTAAFGIGCGVPLLVLAVAGDAIARRTGILRRQARPIRLVAGGLMIVIAVLIGFNLTDGLQRTVPGYTSALQHSVEQNAGASKQLNALTNGGSGNGGAPAAAGGAQCTEGGLTLENCGPAPELTGITAWLNTPGGQPLTLSGLRGKVVLIDFWTYSCINCQRALPHLESWYQAYQRDGLVVIGVHTPEFAFEHVTSNVVAQSAALGVKYPVAVDNNYGTWNAYSNQYWPAEYLIDASGIIRHVSFGEGGYAATELQVRQLLAGTRAAAPLPKPTDVTDATPTEQQTQETYLGYHYAPLHASGTTPAKDTAQQYQFPANLDQDTFALAGTWTDNAEELTAGQNAQLELSYQAKDVYLVIGGTGSVTVQINGKTIATQQVDGVPKLYTLLGNASGSRALLTLSATAGIQAYDFTFG
jgi:cytochrome c biogenesis protein CcdA/thiol-disulfide isomerase/thioredoxin